jgi:hypothetical protein
MIKDIRLQKAEYDSTKEMIKILSKCSTEIQQWKSKWYEFYTEEYSKIEICRKIWHFFGTSISSIDDYIDEMNLIINNLKSAQKLIPKSKNDQKLKDKINAARADYDDIKAKLDELEEEEKNLTEKIEGYKNSSSNNFLNCFNSETRLKGFTQRQKSINMSKTDMKKSLEKKKKTFCNKQVELYEEYEKSEIERCKLLKQRSNDFLKAFDLDSEKFKKLSEGYRPEEEFNRLKQKIFRKNANQACIRQSIETETSSDED